MTTPSAAALSALRHLWRKERRASHERVVSRRKERTLVERVALGVALRDLSVADLDAAPGGRVLLWLTCERPAEVEGLRAGPGDPVRLWWDEPDGREAVRGVLARRRADRVAVMVDGEVPERLLEGAFRLDLDDPLETFNRGERAIERFAEARADSELGRLRAVLFGERAAEFDAERALEPLDAGLNEPQRAAVRRALAARDVALVHGPPGTGKTRTLVEVIRQAVARGERVLATAASNAAVDNLSERLVNLGVDAVRIGHPARVSAAMESRTLDALLERTDAWRLARQWMAEAAEIRKRALVRFERGSIGGRDKRDAFADANRLSRDARKQLQGAQALIVDRARVLCATAAGADAALLPDEPFDLVVIDEATQATDPVALVALSRGRRAVLAGDPHQLPPTVIDLEAAREGLQTTFFERLAGTGQDLVRMLVVQHRMNEAIMAFPSASKYEGRLVAAPEVAGHTLADLGVEDDPLRPGPLVLVDTAGKGWEERREGEDPSTSNPLQAERTAREVRRLLSRGLAPGLAAVITPYDAQVRLLRELLEPEVRAGLEVGTVDGFQGREKEAIVVDLVRSNDEGRIGFLGDTRRMNVALTRARRFLLVIGDSATIGGDRYYSELVEAFEVYGAVVSAWTDEADPLQS